MTKVVRTPNRVTRATRIRPSRQLRNKVVGSSTNSATSEAQFSRKNDSQMMNMPLAASSMTLSSRPEWVAL